MKFFQDKNPPRVWDRDLNKVTVVFQKGEFETEDPSLINLLVRVGYRHNGVFPEPESKPVEKPEPKPAPVKKETPKKVKPKMVRKKK